jgi:hypothetical protein
MHAIKRSVVIPPSGHIELDLPENTPVGEAEIIVLFGARRDVDEQGAIVSIRGALRAAPTMEHEGDDPIATALDAQRAARAARATGTS